MLTGEEAKNEPANLGCEATSADACRVGPYQSQGEHKSRVDTRIICGDHIALFILYTTRRSQIRTDVIPALETAGDRSGDEIFTSITHMPEGTKVCLRCMFWTQKGNRCEHMVCEYHDGTVSAQD